MVPVRKLIANLLLVVFLLPLASAFALGQDADAGLPACCRRNGRHHCAMSMAERAEQGSAATKHPRFQAPAETCPYCPAHCVTLHPDPFVGTTVGLALPVLFSQAAPVPQAACSRRLARERSRHKRGPPSVSLA